MSNTTELRFAVLEQLLDGTPPSYVRDNLNVSDYFIADVINQYLRYVSYPGRYILT
jgi:hypothetical protein